MATGCVSTPDDRGKQRLQVTEGSCDYQEVDLSGGGPEGGVSSRDAACGQHGGEQLTKPRRKDTPVLNAPLHVPGARLLMGEKQTVFLEDEEKDGKDERNITHLN